uniref:Uncharacterized protein n=1 Tax=Arundo donax TaxID=35708 RepID=A0A0A9BI19_ARUDO
MTCFLVSITNSGAFLFKSKRCLSSKPLSLPS